jgi:CHAD domain-containing protein
MWMTASPVRLARIHIETLLELLPRVVDGDVDGVHDARVLTRRVRELLPLTHEWHNQKAADALTARFRLIGRALGRVRDADVRLAMLRHLEGHIPDAAPSLVVVRQASERDRLGRIRELIKGFERLGVGQSLKESILELSDRRFPPVVGRAWRRQLRRTLTERALGASEAIQHATGVYFPNRLHKARIALRKLRYSAEIGELTGVDGLSDAIRDLKKSQDVLGKLHDRQMLVDELPGWVRPDRPPLDATQIRIVTQMLEAECQDLHARYLTRRPRLVEICNDARRVFDRGPVAAAAPKLAASALALTSAVYAWQRLRAEGSHTNSREVSLRIPIDVPSASTR